jgi:glycosyltransferase involved in cell wall biosynthesis
VSHNAKDSALKTDVAVVVTAFNAGKTLAATLESAFGQDHVGEIVVVDDGSRDDTLEIARRYEPRVKVLTGPNRGVSAARNRGVAETTSDWLLFLDSDDLLLPNTVAKRLAAAAGASDADVVICDWEEFIDDGRGVLSQGTHRRIDWVMLGRDPELATATDVWATTAALLYRRSLVERIGGFRADLPVIQDARFLFDASFHGAHFAYAPHIGARYRVVEGSNSRRDPARFWRHVLLNGAQIEELWRARGTLDAARLEALAGVYNNAARGLFAAAHPAYFEAVALQRKLGLSLPRHTRVAAPLAWAVGLRAARSIVSLLQSV